MEGLHLSSWVAAGNESISLMTQWSRNHPGTRKHKLITCLSIEQQPHRLQHPSSEPRWSLLPQPGICQGAIHLPTWSSGVWRGGGNATPSSSFKSKQLPDVRSPLPR